MASHHWPIQISRALFVFFFWQLFCFHIILFVYIIITIETMWRSGKASNVYPSGSEFESQVPHFLNNFVFQVSPCAYKLAVHHSPSSTQAPDGQRPDLVVKSWRSTIVQVNACILDPKKVKKSSNIGLKKLLLTPPNRPNSSFPLYFI